MKSSNKIQELQGKIANVEHDVEIIKRMIKLCNKNKETRAKKIEDKKITKLLRELE